MSMSAKQIALVETELFLKTVMKNKKVEKKWKNEFLFVFLKRIKT